MDAVLRKYNSSVSNLQIVRHFMVIVFINNIVQLIWYGIWIYAEEMTVDAVMRNNNKSVSNPQIVRV